MSTPLQLTVHLVWHLLWDPSEASTSDSCRWAAQIICNEHSGSIIKAYIRQLAYIRLIKAH